MRISSPSVERQQTARNFVLLYNMAASAEAFSHVGFQPSKPSSTISYEMPLIPLSFLIDASIGLPKSRINDLFSPPV